MISYSKEKTISSEQLSAVFKSSGIKRPVDDLARLQEMIDAAPLLITAWYEGQLVGVARSLTDFVYCCYLSDIAVHEAYQKDGVGRALIEKTREAIGPKCSLLLLSAPPAMEYYPKVGFASADNCFVIKREC